MAEFPGRHRSCSKPKQINREEDRGPPESNRCMWGQPPSAVLPGKARLFSDEERTSRASLDRTAEGGCPHMAGGEIMDWRQLWEICSAPDNVPIVGLIPLLGFYIYLAVKQARANDQLIEQLEGDAALAKTHHRKTWPFRAGWQKEVHVWPFLLRIEFLAAIIVTIILMVWSITLNAPLEEPANPNLTMNPAKAPWYFLGLQEMLVYFDPWIAGVVMPTLIIMGLMIIPYVDTNPMGSGYYTWKQRKFAISTFLFGFVILWVSMIIIGTFIRGPGWQWFWPGQTWDHNRLI